MKLISFLPDKFRGCSLANVAIGGWVTALFSPYGYLAMLVASACIIFSTLLWEYFITKSLRVSAVCLCGLGCVVTFLLQPPMRALLYSFMQDLYR